MSILLGCGFKSRQLHEKETSLFETGLSLFFADKHCSSYFFYYLLIPFKFWNQQKIRSGLAILSAVEYSNTTIILISLHTERKKPMKLLEERIRKDGLVKPGNVLKVDNFLNHQMDVELFDQMGEEFKRLFADRPINKILTIEASGIGIACITARHFHVPVVFAKKTQSINLDGESYVTKVESFTHKRTYDVIVSKKYLGPEDHVLIIDDFLANGCAVDGLIDLIQSAGATVEGVGIAIEKRCV